jgi:hypothetical protein
VFVTSTTHGGGLGGFSNADAICATSAAAAGLPGAYRAWLSSSTSSAASRLSHGGAPYVLVDGTVIADDWSDLTDASLQHAIDLDEFGTPVAASEAWTGTQPNGTSHSGNCTNWSGGGGTGLPGLTTATGSQWTQRSGALDGCANSKRSACTASSSESFTIRGGMTKPATVGAAILLTVVALLQLLRAVVGVRVTVGDTAIPTWPSVVAFVVAGGLAVGLWREARRG